MFSLKRSHSESDVEMLTKPTDNSACDCPLTFLFENLDESLDDHANAVTVTQTHKTLHSPWTLRVGSLNTIKDASESLCKIIGYTKEEVLGRSVTVLAGPETDLPRLLIAIKRTINRTRSTRLSSLKIYGRYGRVCHVEVECIQDDQAGADEPICLLHFHRRWNAVVVDLACSNESDLREKEMKHSITENGNLQPRARYNFITGLEIHKALLEASCPDDQENESGPPKVH